MRGRPDRRPEGGALPWDDYVTAHAEEEGQRAPQEGQPRPQAQHGPQLLTDLSLVWFRRDLRLSDNPAWAAATDAAPRVAALFVVDPVPYSAAGPFRRSLLRAHLEALHERLVEHGGGLILRSGDPARVVPSVAAELGATTVHVNADAAPYSARRDAAVTAALGADVDLDPWWGNLVHRPGSVTATATGAAHRVFAPFHRAWSRAAAEPWPEPRPVEVVDPATVSGGSDPLPGAEPAAGPGGEVAADERLAAWLDWVDRYPDTHDLPADPHGTSHLSADLHFGTVSPRHVLDLVGTHTPGRAAFVRQLAWRDWFAHLLVEDPGMGHRAMRPEMERLTWRDDPEGLAAWAGGRTGYPFVDAGMRQLAATGWMHNRLRMVVASFLTKDLLVDWRHGLAHFRNLLVDHEVGQDAGNWQWVAGTGADAAPFVRIFNPVTQGLRFDPDGDYVRAWVPELAAIAGAAIHTPWELGPLELAAAGIELGVDYPERIVDHAAARERALGVHEAARAARHR